MIAKHPASFRGVEFFVSGGGLVFGRRTIVHEFAFSDNVEVEDLGRAANIFQLTMHIYGKSVAEYADKRDALRAALEAQGSGILVHPVEGQLLVSVIDAPHLDESEESSGRCSFTASFIRRVAPAKKKAPGKPLIGSKLLSVIKTLSDAVEKVQTGVSFVNHLFAVSQSGSLLDRVLSVVQAFPGATGPLGSFLSITKDVGSLVVDTTLLAGSFGSLWSNIAQLGSSSDRYKGMDVICKSDAYSSGLSEFRKTFWSDKAESNENILNAVIFGSAFAVMLASATELTYASDEDVDAVLKSLDERYQQITSSIKFDSDSAEALAGLRADVLEYLADVRNDVARVSTINVEIPVPVTVLGFAYYGDDAKAETLLRMNKARAAFAMTGEVKVLSNG